MYYLQRGILYFETGEHYKAIKDYSDGIRINPKNYEAYVRRSMSFYSIRHF
jgi:Tfp pilus assembly protein PilF